jgi:hypothetical protein
MSDEKKITPSDPRSAHDQGAQDQGAGDHDASGQDAHNPETEEDTASGGAAD